MRLSKKFALKMNCKSCIWIQRNNTLMCNRQTCSFEEDPQMKNKRQWRARKKAVELNEFTCL